MNFFDVQPSIYRKTHKNLPYSNKSPVLMFFLIFLIKLSDYLKFNNIFGKTKTKLMLNASIIITIIITTGGEARRK